MICHQFVAFSVGTPFQDILFILFILSTTYTKDPPNFLSSSYFFHGFLKFTISRTDLTVFPHVQYFHWDTQSPKQLQSQPSPLTPPPSPPQHTPITVPTVPLRHIYSAHLSSCWALLLPHPDHHHICLLTCIRPLTSVFSSGLVPHKCIPHPDAKGIVPVIYCCITNDATTQSLQTITVWAGMCQDSLSLLRMTSPGTAWRLVWTLQLRVGIMWRFVHSPVRWLMLAVSWHTCEGSPHVLLHRMEVGWQEQSPERDKKGKLPFP